MTSQAKLVGEVPLEPCCFRNKEYTLLLKKFLLKWVQKKEIWVQKKDETFEISSFKIKKAFF